MKSTMIPIFIFAINFQNETDWRFWKNVTCLQNKKAHLMPTSRHGPFHPILILPLKMVELPQQHANTTVVKPTITNCCKELHLIVAAFLDLSLKTLPCTKPSPASCENQYFFLIISKSCNLYRKPLCFSDLFFTVWWGILISLLDGCYHY